MANNDEYNRLVRRRSYAIGQKNDCEDRIENYDNLLRRLRSARDQIADLKETFKTTKKTDKKLYKEKPEWKGSTYDCFKSKMETVNSTNNDYYNDSIDHVLDSLNNEITRIENDRMYEYGVLGALASTINSLSNSIRNFFN